ncbi:MAG TPA: hypothetical protein VI110_01340 [Lapillicoccus sp.]
MTARDRGQGGMTAEEFVARLAQDTEYQAAKAAFEAELEERDREWRLAERPVVADLRAAGVEVDSAWDLVNTSEPYPDALPVLLEHLERGGYPDRVMEGLARALAVEPARPMWDRLRTLYLDASGPDERRGLAAALAASAGPAQLEALVELLGEDRAGPSRILFVGAILRVGADRGRALVESLRDDPVLGAEASAQLEEQA